MFYFLLASGWRYLCSLDIEVAMKKAPKGALIYFER